MIEKIYTKNNKLVIEISLKARRFNPCSEEDVGEMDNIIALIEDENNMGFCYRIDMDYKGKDDQWTDYFFKWNLGEQKEFEELCRKLEIDIVYYNYKKRQPNEG